MTQKEYKRITVHRNGKTFKRRQPLHVNKARKSEREMGIDKRERGEDEGRENLRQIKGGNPSDEDISDQDFV